jgi:hypothetical protein
MLKIVLSLIGDWFAYRRAISGGMREPRRGFGHVSVWPVDVAAAPAADVTGPRRTAA